MVWLVVSLAALVGGACQVQPSGPRPGPPRAPGGSTWLVWRPCGCAEGCALVREPLGALREGQTVTATRVVVRAGARAIAPGTAAHVEAAPGRDGRPVLVLGFAGAPLADGGHGPTVCGYECEVAYAGAIERTACAGGALPGPGPRP